jgi:hypothetical protein
VIGADPGPAGWLDAIEGYGDPESLKVAEHLDDEVLTLLRSAV